MDKMYFFNGLVYTQGQLRNTTVMIENGKITEIGGENTTDCPAYNLEGKMLIPGFLDIHTHGGAGVDVNSATIEGLRTIADFFLTQGTTGWNASIVTDSKESTVNCIKTIREYIENHNTSSRLLGIHLEGPFLATEYKGSMPEHLLRAPDEALLREYQEIAGGHVKYITLSPELEGAKELIPICKELGIVVSIGHSGAEYEQAMECIHAGAMSATHTFNAMKLLHQHFPAIMGAVLESDIYAEGIFDGRHLHPGVVRLLLKTKGLDRVVAVTDCIMAAGLPDGNYKLGVNDVVVTDGDAKLVSDGTRAGSTLTSIKAFRNLNEFTTYAPEQLIPILTENPAALFGLDDKIGTIDKGKDADLVVMNEDFDIIDVFVKGNKATIG